MTDPNVETARQFALFLSVGAPATEAIRYFLPDDATLSPTYLTALAERWLRSKEVQAAVRTIQGADWSEMAPMERIQLAIDKTYSEMAYFLYSRNYVELSGSDRSKADTCRVTLEAKLAGTAGKFSPLEQFWADVTSGKIQLSKGLVPDPSRGRSTVPGEAQVRADPTH